jgi:hypothetical protein
MRMKWQAVPLTAALVIGGAAQAHQLACEKTVNGETLYVVSEYPQTLHYEFTIQNTHPTDASVVLSAEDPALAEDGFQFDEALPLTLPLGGEATSGFDVSVQNPDECLALAGRDGVNQTEGEGADVTFDNTFRVGWESGSAACTARVVCGGEEQGGGGECTPSSGKTRGLGFWKTHSRAVEACLAAGPIDLGMNTVGTLADTEGILWGSPAKFDDHTQRNKLDHMRFLLMRELLVAECNTRVFGAPPTYPTEFEDAVATLRSTDCHAIQTFNVKLRHGQECGGDNPNTGREFHPADAQHSQSIADDPTAPSGQVCSNEKGGK